MEKGNASDAAGGDGIKSAGTAGGGAAVVPTGPPHTVSPPSKGGTPEQKVGDRPRPVVPRTPPRTTHPDSGRERDTKWDDQGADNPNR